MSRHATGAEILVGRGSVVRLQPERCRQSAHQAAVASNQFTISGIVNSIVSKERGVHDGESARSYEDP